MDKIESTIRKATDLEDKIHDFGNDIAKLEKNNLVNKEEEKIEELLEETHICEKFLSAYKQELLQKIKRNKSTYCVDR